MLALFTFGYWGWGSSTKLLLKATAAVEETRGYTPPMFVDLRVSRSVRATQFSGSAFEKLAGTERYQWMPKLGNQRIRDRTTGAPKIVDPSAATELLELVIARAKQKQRVLAFCACTYPETAIGVCHRTTVGDLVLAAAKKRRVGIEVAEWPGGKPANIEIPTTLPELRRLRPSTHAALLPPWPIETTACVPWGSRITAVKGDERVTFLTEAAKPSRGKLVLPQMAWGYDDWKVAWKEIGLERMGLGAKRTGS